MTLERRCIYLSQDALDKFPSFGVLAVGWGIILMVVFFPFVLIIDTFFNLGNTEFLIVCLVFLLFYSAYIIHVSRGIFKKRKPEALYALGNIFNYRLYLIASIMWIGLSFAHPIWLVFIFILWFLIEFSRFYDRKKISDDMLVKIFMKDYKIDTNNEYLYTPSESVNDKRLSVDRPQFLKLVERLSFWSLGLAIILGPFIFIRSQLYRENFEPRFIIIGILSFLLGLASIEVYSRLKYAHRALVLKKKGVF